MDMEILARADRFDDFLDDDHAYIATEPAKACYSKNAQGGVERVFFSCDKVSADPSTLGHRRRCHHLRRSSLVWIHGQPAWPSVSECAG